MKIGLHTWGSDGDIRPFAALAGGLSAAGHDVTLAITSVDKKNYDDLAEAMNFRAVHLDSVLDIGDMPIAHRVLNTSNPLTQMKILVEEAFTPDVDEINRAAKELVAYNDVVVGHMLIHPLFTAAEKTGTPYATVILCHGMLPSRHLPPVELPNLGQVVNSFVWWLGGKLTDRFLVPTANYIREKEGMPPLKSVVAGAKWMSPMLNIVATSNALAVKPPDWDENIQITGFWNVPEKAEEWTPPEKLQKFLEEGPPPVYMTFGSMTQFDPERMTRLMVEAAAMSGLRVIVQANWDNAPSLPENENVYRVSKLPHSKIFPRCAAIVHHGGAGTTQSATIAGKPSVVVEHAFDQQFWGLTLKNKGAAGKLLHKRSVTANKLAEAMNTTVRSKSMRRKAEELGAIMREENGVERAVELIEERLGN